MKPLLVTIYTFDALVIGCWAYYMYHLIRHPGKASPAEAYIKAKFKARNIDRDWQRINIHTP